MSTDKKNFLQIAADFLGFTSDRVEKMSADEKAKLSAMGEKTANLETERDTAISERDQATQQASDLQASVDHLSQQLQAATEQIGERDQTIADLQAQVSDLEGKLSRTPGAADTTVTKTATEEVPGDKGKEKKIYSWEAPLYRN